AVEWADANYYLPKESAYQEGRWETLPFQRAIMNAMGSDYIREVNVVKSARVGYSKMLLGVYAYFIEHKQRNTLIWLPTDGDAENFMKTHVEPTIRDIPSLLALAPWYGKKHRDNTLTMKRFTNGRGFWCLGGKAAKNYREKSVDVAGYDELAAFDEDIEQEGSPTFLGDKRIEGSVWPKSIRGSTPKVRGTCQIERAASESPHFMRFHVACPHCGEEQYLKFGDKETPFGLKWTPDDPSSVFYLCEHNACVIRQQELDFTDARYICEKTGIWTRDGILWFSSSGEEIEPPDSVTFHIWTAYSPFTTWVQIVKDWMKTKGDTGGDYSTGAAQVILPRVVGSMEVYEQQTSWPLVLQNSKTIVLWGSDLLKNQQANWWCPDHDVYEYYAQLKAKVAAGEIEVISIDPVVTSTHEYLGREHVKHIAVNPQTDVPLQLALAHTLYSENLYDKNFLANYCVGFEQFLPYLLGEKDGQPKDAAWAEKLTGIDAETIRGLARQMAANRTQIIAGWCVQRMQHGEQWAWMIVVLAAMLGQIGLPGGGFGFGWHYNGAGTPGRKGVILSGFSGSTSIPPVHDNSDYKGYSSTIPIARFIDAILEPGKVINWNGKSVKLPPLKMCIFAGTNPFHRHQQINRIIEGLRKLETVIAIDNQWTSTCRFADIVLPATTQFERNDLDQYGNHSNRGIIAMKQVVPPQFEARNDFDIFRELCRRFNREEAFTEGLDEMGWLKRIWQEGVQQGKGRGVHLPAFDDFWNNKEYVEFDHPQMFVRHQAFREDPDLEPLGTPSGLIEIYSKTIADMNYDDCQGHPMWFEKIERSHGGPGSQKYPLHLQSVHPDFRLHSQLCESETLRQQYTVAGKEPVFINPQDASARGIRNGDVVRVFNARGQVLAGAVVSDRYAPGVARIHEGAWYDPDKGGEPGALCKYGNPNVLTIDIGTSQLAQATSAHTTLVEIEKYNGTVEQVTAFNGPVEMVAQCEYVPASQVKS
ncbi:trimethylamine-N-oxide reductase TorA, partial [Escherichia coli]